jgi:hypothetical protein
MQLLDLPDGHGAIRAIKDALDKTALRVPGSIGKLWHCGKLLKSRIRKTEFALLPQIFRHCDHCDQSGLIASLERAERRFAHDFSPLSQSGNVCYQCVSSVNGLRFPEALVLGLRYSLDLHELVVNGFGFSSISKTDSADLASRDGAKSRTFQRAARFRHSWDSAPSYHRHGDQSPSFPAGIGGGMRFAFACWGVFSLPIILGDAISIKLHLLVVLGWLLDWLSTSLLATLITALWRSR